jgi:hypothetical protein
MKRKPQVLCGGNNRRLYSSVVVLRKIDVYLYNLFAWNFNPFLEEEKKMEKTFFIFGILLFSLSRFIINNTTLFGSRFIDS